MSKRSSPDSARCGTCYGCLTKRQTTDSQAGPASPAAGGSAPASTSSRIPIAPIPPVPGGAPSAGGAGGAGGTGGTGVLLVMTPPVLVPNPNTIVINPVSIRGSTSLTQNTSLPKNLNVIRLAADRYFLSISRGNTVADFRALLGFCQGGSAPLLFDTSDTTAYKYTLNKFAVVNLRANAITLGFMYNSDADESCASNDLDFAMTKM